MRNFFIILRRGNLSIICSTTVEINKLRLSSPTQSQGRLSMPVCPIKPETAITSTTPSTKVLIRETPIKEKRTSLFFIDAWDGWVGVSFCAKDSSSLISASACSISLARKKELFVRSLSTLSASLTFLL